MKLPVKYVMISVLAVCLTTAGSGCSPNKVQQQSVADSKLKILNRGGVGGANSLSADDSAHLPITIYDGISYVTGNDLAQALQLHSKWEADRNIYQLGDFDAAYELKIGSNDVQVDEGTIRIAQPPILHNSVVYVPVSALSPLFASYTNFIVTDKEVKIDPSTVNTTQPIDGPEDTSSGGDADFMDDPNDPFKGDQRASDQKEKTIASFAHNIGSARLNDPISELSHSAIPAANLKNVDVNQLIAKAESYIGVKYLFGAPPYPQSAKFDCSTFTRYIYGRYGIPLGRTARAQAAEGTSVSRKQLRKGDLLFFYVPGRFRSNKTVGHVAIYMGNNRVIHASPSPENGVQITNIDKPYWKETFLEAKRFVY
ncbi:Cell wall-associated hydrolase, NlpC family [Paenibacillus sp. 1_12]|uniref:C40 family peptidase n=1 Tax=Paenibacillus sp. 1_12 TaxID=1566278 RepID=UPI0008F0965D|nr:C40 family peptidase [Paenibacillus sp. 1_12]SFM19790.1 Cell wall-associated hydrolase, NlpC family [Paenibacillus sp. 1_12]